MEHLFSTWDKTAKILANSRHILLLFDYDGTLTPIAESLELAVLPQVTFKILQELVKNRNITVGIISGRALSDLKKMVTVKGIIYAGNHGLEIEGPGLSFIYPLTREIKSFFGIINQMLNKALSATRGVVVENKGLTLSVHYRQVKEENVDEVKSTFDHIISGAQVMGKIKITNGKKVLEVRPVVDWDKGKAVKMIIEKYCKGNRDDFIMPIYVGDDLTDEDAFSYINIYKNGISIYIGENPAETGAHYYLNSTDEILSFLQQIVEISGINTR